MEIEFVRFRFSGLVKHFAVAHEKMFAQLITITKFVVANVTAERLLLVSALGSCVSTKAVQPFVRFAAMTNVFLLLPVLQLLSLHPILLSDHYFLLVHFVLVKLTCKRI